MNTSEKIGRYEILEELGRGAMGVVYRAKDPAMERIVALKTIISVVLQGPDAQEFRERFYREARTAGAMSHPGIVAVFDVGEHEGMPFLVMEYIMGRTLADAVKEERQSLERVCELGAQIASALGYAHRRGVVHRDIKPANILLTSGEAYGVERPKITDFGVAKLAEGQTTLTGKMLGTPAFMPPEQFTGSPIDGRSDIFSLGVVLYWMATGEQPFPGESITAVSYKVVQTEPVPPRKLNPSITPGLDRVILKCLAKDPGERYQTGEDLSSDLSDLRAAVKGGLAMRTSSTPLTVAIDPDATFIGPSRPVPASAPAASMEAAATGEAAPANAAGRGRNNPLALVAVVIALVAVVIGGFSLLRRQNSADQSVAPASAAVTEAPSSPTDASAASRVEDTPAAKPAPAVAAASATPPKTIASVPPRPSVSAPAAEHTTVERPAEPVAAPKPTPPKITATVPELVPVDFDPKALDRKQSARLEIDAQRMPPLVEFALEMNGKIYLHKTGSAPFKADGDLYVPPGVHEFRVTAKSGEVQKVSNTVSTDFKANKRNNLKIELRLQGMSADAGMPQDLYPNSQVVLTLK